MPEMISISKEELENLRESARKLNSMIAERKKQEEPQPLAWLQLLDILRSISDGFFTLDDQWRYTYVNSNAARMVFRKPEDLLGKVIWEVFPEAINSPFYNLYHHVMTSGEVTCFEHFFPSLNSWYEGTVYPNKKGISIFFKNITDRKKAQDALKKEHDQFQVVLDSLDASIYVTDMTTYEILFINKYGRDMWGDAVGSTCWKTMHPGQNGPCSFCSNAQILLPNGEPAPPVVWEFQNKVNNHWFECRCQAIQWIEGQLVRIVITTDITRRKRAERILHSSEEWHRLVLKTAMDGFWLVDVQGHILEVNDTYCRMSGYSEQELLTMSVPDLEAAEIPVETASHLQRIISEGEDRFESVHRRKDGSTFNVEVSVQFRPLNGGRMVGFMRDITARKKTEETIRASESKYRRLHQSMMDGYVYVNISGKIEDFNEPFRRMLGYSPEELRELTFWDVTPERWHAWQDSVIREQVFSRGYSDVYEKEYRKKDGTIFPVEIRTSLIKDDSGNNIGMWAIVRDISERTLAQKEKDRSYRERMEEKQRHLMEREGLLMDLHDGVGGLVTNIRLLADLSQKKSDKESIKKALGTISRLSADAISEIRGLMHSLDSREMNWRTLVTMLRSDGATMIETHGMSFTAETKIDSSDQPGGLLWVNLFRIYKEALTNIIKHAHAKSVMVTLHILKNKLTLEVQDDGIGWKDQTVSGRGHSIMQKRAKDLRGTLTVSTGSAGTRVSLEVPLPTGCPPVMPEAR